MSDLQSSSLHRDKGLMSPWQRGGELKRIIRELRPPETRDSPASPDEVSGAQDLCFRLYSAEVADMMADRLGTTRQQIRETLDAALRWKPEDHTPPETTE